jgi:hypothetical protein
MLDSFAQRVARFFKFSSEKKRGVDGLKGGKELRKTQRESEPTATVCINLVYTKAISSDKIHRLICDTLQIAP